VKDASRRLKKSLHRKKVACAVRPENVDYNKIVLAVDSFINIHTMSNKDFLEKIFVGAFKLIPEAEKGSFYELIDDRYVPIVSSGYDLEVLQKLVFNREDAFADYECSDSARIEAYEKYIDERDDTRFSEEMINILRELGTYSKYTSLYAPIQVEGVNVGLICFDCFTKTGFTKTSKKILKFYAQIISNFYTQKLLYEKEKKMYHDVVAALVSAIEVKDKYTEGHAQRVREYSCDIAKELQLSNSKINDISTAALLHDIGKIGISTEILNKPGKLTKDEYDIIKLHPIYTKTILEKISGFSSIANFAYNHHENYNGTGYPRGLKYDEIPFESQIIQVADAYDAMTSERAYRKALSTHQALKIISEETGKQFNPKIAKAAIKVFSKLTSS
jgi:polar amino acid transport system substrate-binding protein